MFKERSKKNPGGFVVLLSVLLAVQLLLMSLTLAYAFWGSYELNQPANIWSILWDDFGLGMLQFLFAQVAVVVGIVGLVLRKIESPAGVLSILLIDSLLPSFFCLILVFGAHY